MPEAGCDTSAVKSAGSTDGVRLRAFGGLLFVYVALGILYVFRPPVFGKPDELYHFAYAAYLRVEGQLPTRDISQPPGRVARLSEPEAHQPPLYYGVVALLGYVIGATPDATVVVSQGDRTPSLLDLEARWGDIAEPNPYFLSSGHRHRLTYAYAYAYAYAYGLGRHRPAAFCTQAVSSRSPLALSPWQASTW